MIYKDKKSFIRCSCLSITVLLSFFHIEFLFF
nr:MAG TPA: hypothetical protein [Caudoviricetes sp.]